VDPKSLNECFVEWTKTLLPKSLENLTVSFDGKTIRSTGKMDSYDEAIHIVSAHVAELGITIGQKTVDGKSNEIPAVQELIRLLDIRGCMVVADALNCQKKTAKAIIESGGNYLLNVKGNQETLEKDIKDYVQDSNLQKSMDTASTFEKNRDRLERRTAYTTSDISWLPNKEKWESLACIGAIHRETTTINSSSSEWHYLISSRQLTAKELLKYARNEWSVETMHWLLDVHFGEDFCNITDADVQQSMNIARKFALNNIKAYKDKSNSKLPLSKLMLTCLIDSDFILTVLGLP
jgi:predicted transposase YbfD/YdcC